MNKTILVTGSNGQLGSEIKDLVSIYPSCSFVFVDRKELDITDKSLIKEFFKKNKIDYCINGAAYTAVDNAENDIENAFKVNAESVNNLAEICNKYNSKLIQISTDFVFDGKSSISYKETDIANPLSVYGKSKYKGEEYALEDDALVIRTSWLYSTYGNNFVKTMRRLGSEREELNIISDQIGTPTYAKDLAEVIMELISNFEKDKLKGLYHFSNDGIASWYDFSIEIFKLSNVICKVSPIPTSEYPTPAERPKYSLMDKSKIINDFDVKLIDWKQSLKKCITKLENEN